MSEWAAAALVVGLLVVVGGPLLWWVLTSGHDAEATRAATARFRERQKRPDFEAYRRQFGCDPPEPLMRLLNDTSLFTDDHDSFTVMLPSSAPGEGWYVAWIEPIDAEHFIRTAMARHRGLLRICQRWHGRPVPA